MLGVGCESGEESGGTLQVPDVIATNAFYYYADVDAAWRFYRDTLDMETVVDYGFAKIMRLASSSYVTLVAAESGMHSVDEPKTVLLTLMADDPESWRKRLAGSGYEALPDIGDRSIPGFVIRDPEGYLIRMRQARAKGGVVNGVREAVFSIYVSDLRLAGAFYEGLFEVEPLSTAGASRLYQLSGSGFLELIEGGDGFLQVTSERGVTLSFLTSDVDAWIDRATAWPGFELRTDEVLNEGGLVRVFVGYGPEGHFLEWDTFLDVEDNADLLKYLP